MRTLIVAACAVGLACAWFSPVSARPKVVPIAAGPAVAGSLPLDHPNADARGAYSSKLEGWAERGGVPAHGPFGETYYRIRYHDSGKFCRDNAQCTGGCVYRPTSGPLRKPERRVAGTCKRANVEFGCFVLVAHGRVEHLFCVD